MRFTVFATLVLVEHLASAGTTAFPNDKPAFEFFIGKGLTPVQAAGIVGNLDQESGVDPKSVEGGGGPGRGIAQWSVGGRWDSSSHDNVVDFAAMQGEPATSLNVQLEFVWYELTSIGYGYAQLTATTNVTDATVVFMSRYEICGTCAQSQRVAYAKAVLAAYGAEPPPHGDIYTGVLTGEDPSNEIGGCSAAGGGPGAALVALGMFLRRRRSAQTL